jgi:hypothetical protein
MANKQKKSVTPTIENKTTGIQEDVWIPAVCHLQCVDQACSMKVHRVNGVAVGIAPNRDVKDFEKLTKG